MMPVKFSKPWVEIDPDLKHGGIDGELAPHFVGPDLGDNTNTLNPDSISVFNAIRDVGQSISMAPEAMSEAQVGRRIVEEALSGVNNVFESVIDVTHTDATKFFEWNHAVPPRADFPQGPLRYPLRNPFSNEFVFYCIGSLVEVAELNRNALHGGLDPQSSKKLIAPLYKWKAKLMKNLFDMEVAGEISMQEMLLMFEGKFRPGPIVSPPDDTAERPTDVQLQEALSGADVMQWFPSENDWAVFGKLNMARYMPERIRQPEGALTTTEDVLYPHKTTDDGTPITGSTGQP